MEHLNPRRGDSHRGTLTCDSSADCTVRDRGGCAVRTARSVGFNLRNEHAWWPELARYVPFPEYPLPALCALGLSLALAWWWRLTALVAVALVVIFVMDLAVGRSDTGESPCARSCGERASDNRRVRHERGGEFASCRRAAHCRFAFSSAALGYGYTQGHELKLGFSFLRIDHILVSPTMGVRACCVGGTDGSEHRPVIVDLLPAPNSARRASASRKNQELS